MRRKRRRRRSRIRFLSVLQTLVLVALVVLLVMVLKDDKTKPMPFSAVGDGESTSEPSQQAVEEIQTPGPELFAINSDGAPFDGPMLDAADVLNDPKLGEIIIDPVQFQAKAEARGRDSVRCFLAGISQKMNTDGSEVGFYALQFTGYTAEGGNMPLTVETGKNPTHIILSGKPTTYFIPVVETDDISYIDFCLEYKNAPIVLESVYLVRYSPEIGREMLSVGSYANDDPLATTVLREKDFLNTNSRQCLVKEDYLFSLQSRFLEVYKKGTNGWENVYKLRNLNSLNRDMEFTADKNAIVITARQAGMYLVDVTNPEMPEIASHFDTLDATMGLCVDGNYAFLCDRYFGVEIVDISDITHPRYVNEIKSDGDFQDCAVSDGKLFVGDNKNKRIVVFDIEDLNRPERLCEIPLDGNGQGLSVQNNLLYAATALNERYNSSDEIWNYGTGTGNGLEIYDVSDISQPKCLSITKVDGRMSVNKSNVWDVSVAGGYAYFSDMYNGVIVYDVTDPTAPVKVAHYEYVTPSDESINGQYAVNWDAAQESRGVAWHCLPADGKIYISMEGSGLAVVDCSFATAVPDREAYPYRCSERPETVESSELLKTKVFRSEACFWSVDTHGDEIIAACGENGIQRFTRELEPIDVYKTEGSVQDVAVFDDLLIAAEGTAGIGIYRIGDQLELLSRFKMDGLLLCSALGVSADGKTVLAQASIYEYIVLDITDPYEPKLIVRDKDAGGMQGRNICTGLVEGKYLGVYGSSSISWYAVENGKMKKVHSENRYYNERNGLTAIGDLCLELGRNGYYCFDVNGNNLSEYHRIQGYDLSGKCISEGNVMVVSDQMRGKISIVDITQLDAPALIDSISVNGTPDIACFMDDAIIIPCRYGGLIRVTR